jgi:hypothetical protein
MLWVVTDPTSDGSPDTVFSTVILGSYSYGPLFLNFGGLNYIQLPEMPKSFTTSCTTSAMKAGTLSNPIDTGISNFSN